MNSLPAATPSMTPTPTPKPTIVHASTPVAHTETMLHLSGTIRLRLNDYLLEEQSNGGADFASASSRGWPTSRSYRLMVPEQHAAALHAAIDQRVDLTGWADGDDARRWAIVVDSIAAAPGASANA